MSLQVMVRHSSDPATDEAISELKGKVKLIIENIAELRHQLNDIVSIHVIYIQHLHYVHYRIAFTSSNHFSLFPN